MELSFRNALTNDASRLTEIAFAAKRTWNYPEEYYQIWKDELTITERYVEENEVFIASLDKVVMGFVSIVCVPAATMFGHVEVSAGYWMDHLFIDPGFQQLGIGRLLVNQAMNYCKEQQIACLKIFVDPNAKVFYEKMGATFLKDSPSSIKRRRIPVYLLEIK